MKVRLHDFYTGAVRKTIICSLEGGKGYTNKTFEFEPGVEYEVHDPIVKDYFRGVNGDVREHWVKTPETLEILKAHGVKYEISKCSTCPTAKPQVLFNPFVVEEEDGDNVPVQE